MMLRLAVFHDLERANYHCLSTSVIVTGSFPLPRKDDMLIPPANAGTVRRHGALCYRYDADSFALLMWQPPK